MTAEKWTEFRHSQAKSSVEEGKKKKRNGMGCSPRQDNDRFALLFSLPLSLRLSIPGD
jgi:hypothetical protein